MCMHVEGINGEVIGGKVERLEDLLQGELFAISVNDDVLRQGDWVGKKNCM